MPTELSASEHPGSTHRAMRKNGFSFKCLKQMAPRAGFEPATNRLTAGCSTAELPGSSAFRRERAYSSALLAGARPSTVLYAALAEGRLRLNSCALEISRPER